MVTKNNQIQLGVMFINVMGCSLEVTEFELLFSYYVYLRTNTIRKCMDLFYPPIYGLNSITTVFL